MIKRIYGLGSTALGVALLSACGSTTPVTVDMSNLSTGDNNQVSTGGYIWTYTDHNKTPSKDSIDITKPETLDYHAIITPVTSKDVALKPIVDSDPNHGNVINVSGQVPGQIPWPNVAAQDAFSVDTYWPTVNKNGLNYSNATVPAYPAAGVGFGFKPGNELFDSSVGGKYVGIAFDLKVNVDQPLVWVSFPMSTTDLPDPNNDDLFPKSCEYYTKDNNPDTGGSSCFTNYRKGIFSAAGTAGQGNAYNTLGATKAWKRFCVLFSEVAVPNWANVSTKEKMTHIPFSPAKAIKVQWDMYQPGVGADPAPFDVSLDNINLITAEQAKDAVNNCDQARIGLADGSGDAGH